MFWAERRNYFHVKICILFILVCLIIQFCDITVYDCVHVWGFSLKVEKRETPSCTSLFSQSPGLCLACGHYTVNVCERIILRVTTNSLLNSFNGLSFCLWNGQFLKFIYVWLLFKHLLPKTNQYPGDAAKAVVRKKVMASKYLFWQIRKKKISELSM